MSNVTCEKRQQVERHRATMKHVSARGAIEDENKKATLTQQLLLVVSKDFMAELVKTFFAADIPLHKLRNLHVIQLFENLGEKMPSETVCRDYVKTLANNEQDRLKYLLKDKCTAYSWSSMRVKWIRRNLSMLFWKILLMCPWKRISSSAALLRRTWTKASSAWR